MRKDKYCYFRLNSEGEIDYTKGIFQSIGFKEFHDYLLLSAEERETEAGKKEFDKGVELLKLATRQYARYVRLLKGWSYSNWPQDSVTGMFIY